MGGSIAEITMIEVEVVLFYLVVIRLLLIYCLVAGLLYFCVS